jgi:L-Ala-D/L-Glu epimerase
MKAYVCRKMKVSLFPYTFQLKHAFNLAIHQRTTTPAVFLKIEFEGIVGWGEASLPPYLGETQESVLAFIQSFPWNEINPTCDVSNFMEKVDMFSLGNNAAKACMDLAWHDFQSKKNDLSCRRFLGINQLPKTPTSYTIGIHSPSKVQEIANQADVFKVLKIKLGGEQDRAMIQAVRKVSKLPIFVDVNQGWKSFEQAADELEWLSAQNVILAEQPFPKEWLEESARLKELQILPIFGDESIKRLGDLEYAGSAFDGVNIKLMKSTGIHEALKMIQLAKQTNLKVMLGSMTESSLATQAANCLSPLVDFVDLDGPWLIANNPCETPMLINGIVQLPDGPGIGVVPAIN